ncbi:Fc.00g054140.m01.CDS01 [Cosmosporella sp. VM-42]
MDSVRRLLGGSPRLTQPAYVQGDEIYPMHIFDDSKTVRDLVLTWTMRFNDVLDAAKLNASLSRLLEIGDWRKLGGRVRRRADGRLEMHVPKTFTTERPGVIYTHDVFNLKINEHPLARSLPKATDGPSVQAGPLDFRVFAARSDAPATIEDFICRDVPQLSLHITSFDDATLVALSWPHTLMDAMGQKALLEAWSLVVAGRESEVPPVFGSKEDVMSAAGDPLPGTEDEEFQLVHKRLKGFGMVMFVLRLIWDMLWNRVVQDRTIFLPKDVVAQMRRRAQEEATATLGPDDEKPFISEGDVLTAWATQLVASSEPRPRPVTIMSALNLRFWVKSMVQPGGVYIQNMALGTFTFLSPEMARGPVGEIAAAHREHLRDQTSKPQLRGFLRLLRDERKAGGDGTIVCGEPNAQLIIFSNWTKAHLIKAGDFGAAVVRQGESTETRSNPLGTMTYLHNQSLTANVFSRNVVVMVAKDHEENYWLFGLLLPRAWAKIEETIESMQMQP